MGLTYEIGQTRSGSYYYNVYDQGKITGIQVDVTSGASYKNEFTEEYVQKVIKETLEVM